MKQILLVMQREIVASALHRALANAPGTSVLEESRYSMALLAAEVNAPTAVLVEIPETGAWTAERCLGLCGVLHRHMPEVPILVLCPEKDEAACTETMRSKHRGEISDFVFYDASIQYIVSKLMTM